MSATELKPPADGFTSRYPDTRFDALLVVSFGGPEGMADVMPFLENVTRGRNIPRERLEDVAHHYERFGGVSPLNAQNRALIDALRSSSTRTAIELPVYLGNRNWHPLLADTLRQMRDDGVERALAFFTSGFCSYSGCRQYRENLYEAQQEVGPDAPEVLKTRMFFNHPGWIEANADHVRAALARDTGGATRGGASRVHGAFDPVGDGASVAVRGAAAGERPARGRGGRRADTALVYQSRSGPPQVPWLEPGVLDHLRALRERGVEDVVLSPDRFRLGPHRGAVRPRRRGTRVGGGAGLESRARVERVDAPGVRLDDPGAGAGTPRAGCRAAGGRPLRREPRRVPGGLLPARHGPAEPLGRPESSFF